MYRVAVPLALLLSLAAGVWAATLSFSDPTISMAAYRVREHLENDAVCAGAFQRLYGVDAEGLFADIRIIMEPMPEPTLALTSCSGPLSIRLAERLIERGDVRLTERILVHELSHLARCKAGRSRIPVNGEMDIGALMEALCYGESSMRTRLIRQDYCKANE